MLRKFQLLKFINTLYLQWAKLRLRNGTAANVKLNYNSVFGEIQYIDPKNGDTLSLAVEKDIRFIAVEKDTFYFDEGWMELIGGTPDSQDSKEKIT